MANEKISDYTEALSVANDDLFEISVDLGGGAYETRKVKKSNMGIGGSPLTTKGDLYTYDSSDARLAVGSDGQVLLADSAEVTGLRWGNLSADNMATADLTLTGLRTHDLAGNVLKFDNGQVTIEGAGSTNATTSLLIQNSLATQMLKIDDSGGFALGLNASYNDYRSVTIGNGATTSTAGTPYSIAIGNNATSTGLYGIAIGGSSNSGGGYNVVIGYGASASSTGSAIGYGATATGSTSLAVGSSASSGTNGTSIGHNATNNGYGVAVGRNSSLSSGGGGLALGTGAQVTGNYSMIFSATNFGSGRTNSTTRTAEFYFNAVTSTFRFGETVDGWLNSTGGFVFGASTVDSSAALQVDSTTKGFLPPRMTTTEKNAISTPSTGLVVFDSTLAKLCVYTGAAWETVTSA